MEAIGYFGFGVILLFLLIVIAILIVYIYTLVRQLKLKQYTWFVLTLLFSAPVLVIYWIVKLFGGVK